MHHSPLIFQQDPRWEQSGSSRVPFWAYTSDDVYRRELERFFYSGHWCYVGLEAEVANPGDFKRTAIGARSVIMVRSMWSRKCARTAACAFAAPMPAR